MRLEQPRYCPVELWELCDKCWSLDPKDRPSFEKITQQVKDIREKMKNDVQVYVGLFKVTKFVVDKNGSTSDESDDEETKDYEDLLGTPPDKKKEDKKSRSKNVKFAKNNYQLQKTTETTPHTVYTRAGDYDDLNLGTNKNCNEKKRSADYDDLNLQTNGCVSEEVDNKQGIQDEQGSCCGYNELLDDINNIDDDIDEGMIIPCQD